jgi:hypothetical protein
VFVSEFVGVAREAGNCWGRSSVGVVCGAPHTPQYAPRALRGAPRAHCEPALATAASNFWLRPGGEFLPLRRLVFGNAQFEKSWCGGIARPHLMLIATGIAGAACFLRLGELFAQPSAS